MPKLTIRDVDDVQLLELALAENVHRRNMHPLDEAEALARLQTLDPSLNDLEVLGGKVGRSASYVRDKLKLLRLEPVVVEALEASAIHEKHAERIARLPADQHETALAACFARLLVEFDGPIGWQIVTLEDELSERLGIKVDLVARRALRPHIGARVLAEAMPV